MQPTRARIRRHVLVFGTASAVSLACGEARRDAFGKDALMGEWRQEGTTPRPWADVKARQTFVFRPDSSAVWILAVGSRADTIRARYRLDGGVTPARLDFLDFDRGKLMGWTLHCIAEVVDTWLRTDCRPGDPGRTPQTARPTTFTAQTLTFHRRESR